MMASDPERDLIPMKEVKGSLGSHTLVQTEGSDVQGTDRPTAFEQKIAVQLSRNVLEDKFFHLKDENIQLKKNSRKQEEQLKKLATKMSRLISEKKKMELNTSPGRKRDIEMEEMVEDLNEKVRNLEKSNVHLREKLLVAKQQVISHNRRPNVYSHVPPKINTGRPRSGISPYMMSANLRGRNTSSAQRRTTATPLPPYAINLLEEARNELFILKEFVSSQKTEIDMYDQEVEIMKERFRIKETEFEEETNALKSKITQGQRQHVQENLDLIRLHRELKQKNSILVSLQAQYADLEAKMKAQKVSHDHLMTELDDMANHLKEEQKKSMELFGEVQKNQVILANFSELQENIKSIKKENEILKDTNDKLIKSVLNQEKDKTAQSIQQSLKDQITQLESSLNIETKEKKYLKEEISTEKEKCQKINEEYLQLQETFTYMKTEMEELESKVNLLKSEEVDFEELGEALALVKLKKQRSIKLNFLEKVPSEEEEDLKSKLRKSEAEHAESIKELCNVREMLMTQYKINKDAQDEIRSLTEKSAQLEKEYETKIEEYAHLLDIRASRIQKLERQMKDIAYGTKKFKITVPQDVEEDANTIELGRGENLFEIHIIKFMFSKEGLEALNNSNPSSFMTWCFYEFELQATPVVKGSNPHFNCTCQYTVKVDDFFLYCLHKNKTTLELHESFGTDYRTLAACQLNFSEVIEQPHGRLHGSQQLISVSEEAKGIIFGTVDFWVRLRIPMEEAFKLYKEKFKALKYIQSNQETSSSAFKLLNQPYQKDSNINDLHIKIIRCANLKTWQKDVQPSSFCIYKFYDLPDQDTIIIPSSNNPEFSDHRTFPLFMDSDVDKYLKTQNLEIYVFDDSDSDLTSYIGKTSISLLPLSQDKPQKGVFELMKDNKNGYGSIEVSLYWQHPYHSLSSSVSLPKHLDEPIEYPSHMIPLMPVLSDFDDEITKDETDYSAPHIPVPKPRTRMSLGKQSVTSTPMKDASESSSSSSSPKTVTKFKSPATTPVRMAKDRKASLVPQPALRTSIVQPNTDRKYEKMNLKSPEKDEERVKPPKRPPRGTLKQETQKSLREDKDDEDTMKEEKQEISFEEISDEDKQALSSKDFYESAESETESEIQVSENANVPVSSTIPSIVIGIHHLSMEPNTPLVHDTNIQMLYVEYRFLDYPLEELETPFSLPKPVPHQAVNFNFNKVFPFHPKKDVEKWRLLIGMFDANAPEASWIKFTVVSEPTAEQQDLDCEDVGYAYVDLREIYMQQKDIVKEDIILYDTKDNKTEIGKLNVTIEALRVLQLLQDLKK